VAIVFLLVPLWLIAYGVRRARAAADPTDRAFLAATVGALIALMLSCVVGAYLQDPNTMLMFGIVCGLLLAAGLRAVPRGATAASPVSLSG
jgi:hypothetical protein